MAPETKIGAGLTWAVPVRPDVLGEHLDRFMTTIPTLRALRLCHRFGQGSDAHITKLPIELEQAVEDLIVSDALFKSDHTWNFLSTWKDQFKCFESRCQPMSHMEDVFSPLDDAVEDVDECENCEEDRYFCVDCLNQCKKKSDDKCKTCEGGVHSQGRWRCEKSCTYARESEMNSMAADSEMGDWIEMHEHTSDAWLKRIDQKIDGNFVKYDEVLKEHFGLKAFFSQCRMSEEGKDSWPHHRNRRWHWLNEPETTICYLTLPDFAIKSSTYTIGEMEAESGGANVRYTQTVQVRSPVVSDKGKMRARFHCAMNALGLRPWLHPSQELMVKQSKRTRYGKKSQWPQLLFLVSGNYDCEW